jgi:regulatory protein
VAARWLARAARTEAELLAYLVGLGYREATATATVARCLELGYVGDAVYARDRARALRARGAGSLRIAAELESRGVPEAVVEAAVDESREGQREAAWAGRALARVRLDLEVPAARARAWRLLAGRGFPEDVVAELLGDD